MRSITGVRLAVNLGQESGTEIPHWAPTLNAPGISPAATSRQAVGVPIPSYSAAHERCLMSAGSEVVT